MSPQQQPQAPPLPQQPEIKVIENREPSRVNNEKFLEIIEDTPAPSQNNPANLPEKNENVPVPDAIREKFSEDNENREAPHINSTNKKGKKTKKKPKNKK